MARVAIAALLLLGCAPRGQVAAQEPSRDRAAGWCVEGELLAGEIVELCTEDLGTCRQFRALGALAVRRNYVTAVGDCRPERNTEP